MMSESFANSQQKSTAVLKSLNAIKLMSPAFKQPQAISQAQQQPQQPQPSQGPSTPVKTSLSSNVSFSAAAECAMSPSAKEPMRSSTVGVPSTPLSASTPSTSNGGDRNEQNWVKSRRLKLLAENLKDCDSVEDLVRHQEELAELQARASALQTSNSVLQSQITQLKQEKQLAEEKVTELRQDVKYHSSTKETLLQELSRKTSEREEFEASRHQMEAEASALRNKIAALSNEQSDLIQQRSSLQATVTSLRAEIENMRLTIVKKDEQLQQALQVNEHLQHTLTQEELLHKRSVDEFEQHLALLKQEYFFSMALAIKLTFVAQDLPFNANQSIQSMWELVNEKRIPFGEWKREITRMFV